MSKKNERAGIGEITVRFTVNGELRQIRCDANLRLLDILRDYLGLTGTKEGCGEGECGACSVLFDGKLANSCLIPIAQADGARVETIEGLRESAVGRSLSDAFARTHAVQCGFCTPGMMMAAASLLESNADPGDLDVRRAISGNICRCTGYDMIVEGVRLAASELRDSGAKEGGGRT
jgi:carbon-monoxide dehydrogenase small subunit